LLSSDRSGQIDVWRTSLGKQSPQQITSSPTVEWVTDVGADGRSIAVIEEREYSNVWLWDARTAETRQLTAEAVQDLWASVSAERGLVAFQRSKATNQTVPYIFNSNVFTATISKGELSEPRLAVGNAAVPHVSPNGQWLTYVKPPSRGQWELWLKDLRSEHQWRLSRGLKPSGFSTFPLDWSESNLAWTRKSDAVYFVERGKPNHQEIRRASPLATEAVPVVTGAADVNLHDLQISADGRLLAYTRTSIRSPWRSEVMVRSLASGEESIAFSRAHDRHDRVSCKGWRRSGQLVVLQSTENADEHNHSITAFEIDSSGKETQLAVEPHAFASTARVDSSMDSLILTAVDPRGFHNLLCFSLADGQKRWLTHNRLPGISFASPETVPNQQILFSRQEANSDLWLINFSH